jgi:hypothetical protein
MRSTLARDDPVDPLDPLDPFNLVSALFGPGAEMPEHHLVRFTSFHSLYALPVSSLETPGKHGIQPTGAAVTVAGREGSLE